MDGKDEVICTTLGLLGLLGLISAAAGFAAEATRITRSEIQKRSESDDCRLPSNPAMFLALVIARIIIDISTRCICCKRKADYPSNVNWKVARLSWSAFVAALGVLLYGAQYSNKSPEVIGVHCMYYGVQPGVFAGGVCASLISVILGIITYTSFSSAKNSSNQPV